MAKAHHLAGKALMGAIIENRWLDDPPHTFTKEAVRLALEQEGVECARTTLDSVLRKLVEQGFMERQANLYPLSGTKVFFEYRFAFKDRTSSRPGYGDKTPKEEQVGWQTWENVLSSRSVGRINVYLGIGLRAEVRRRVQVLGMSEAAFVKACVQRFVRHTTEDTDPEE